MAPKPENLSLDQDGALLIDWQTGERKRYPVKELRDRCPCATCREKRQAPPLPRGQLPVLSAAEAQPLRILGMAPVGSYAYSIQYSDGHDTGIYTLGQLYEIGVAIDNTAKE